MTPQTFGRARLRAHTREIDALDDVLAYASPTDPTVWARRGDILIGVGEVARFEETGPDAVARVATQWRDLTRDAVISDKVGIPGSGLVAFGAMPFDPETSASSTLLRVPSVIVGHREGRSWVTVITCDDDDQPYANVSEPDPQPFGPHWTPTSGPGQLTAEGYQDAVRAGLAAITAGEVSKVVLARDLVGTIPAESDLRRLVRALSGAYPDTWTFSVDGLIGASPETLVTVSGGTVTARVLAGTIGRGADADEDAAAALALTTSTKDQDEHRFAVQSLLTTLRPHTSALVAAEEPFTLKLPNVFHLATDVEGTLSSDASALDLLGAVHPTAAVAGTPTRSAIEAIRRIEPFDRGRYAGPVGWIDAHGDGEWAIALRCAQFDVADAGSGAPMAFTAHAGAGIVAGSDPETELLETRVKFRPIVDALA